MLSPKRTKYRKAHKGRIHGVAKGGTTLNFGAFGLKALEPGRITARQIEAARRTITRTMRRSGRVWIRIFPDVPVSSKPAEVRMGSGKGSPEFWVCRVKPGRIMFELDGVTPEVAREAFELAAAKLPIGTRFVDPASRRGDRVKGAKASDLRTRSDDELGEQVDNLGKEIFNLRFQRASGQLENTARVRQRAARDRAHQNHPRRAAPTGVAGSVRECRNVFCRGWWSATPAKRP